MARNTKIEETLNLPSMEDILKSTEPTVDVEIDYEQNEKELESVLVMAETAGKNLELLDGSHDHNVAMDEIHEKTLKHADELMDLGFNVDQRSQASIFEKANMLYKTALDAKASKRDAQLKTFKLMLDQKRLEIEEKRLKIESGNSGILDGEAVIVDDRNALIKLMREKKNKD
jgi:hypothetical protein